MMRILLLLAALVALLALPVLIFGDRFATDTLLDFIRSDSPWTALLGILAICADLVIPMPAHAIMTSFGMTRGWFAGGLLGATGTFSAGVLAYWLCRMLGQRAVIYIAGQASAARLHAFFERYGLWAIAVSRWIPLVPEVVSCLAGATHMSHGRFLTGNLIGSLTVGFAYATLGAMSSVPAAVLFSLSVIVPLCCLALFSIFVVRSV